MLLLKIDVILVCGSVWNILQSVPMYKHMITLTVPSGNLTPMAESSRHRPVYIGEHIVRLDRYTGRPETNARPPEKSGWRPRPTRTGRYLAERNNVRIDGGNRARYLLCAALPRTNTSDIYIFNFAVCVLL